MAFARECLSRRVRGVRCGPAQRQLLWERPVLVHRLYHAMAADPGARAHGRVQRLAAGWDADTQSGRGREGNS